MRTPSSPGDTRRTVAQALLALFVVLVPSHAQGPTEPASAGGAGAELEAEEPASGLAPDENPEDADGAQGSFSYYFVPGTTLRSRESATGWDYSGSGCSYSVGGSDRIMNTELQIPDGSTIKFLRLYYLDTSTTADVLGYITRYQTGVATADLISVSSTGSAGFGTVLSAELTETVDNFDFAYVLIGWPDISSTTVQVCGLRVAYYPPV